MILPEVVKIGFWKGGFVISLAKKLKKIEVDAVVIAVDTWLGSWDHWLSSRWFGDLKIAYGYPTLYQMFASNVRDADVHDCDGRCSRLVAI